MKKVFLLTVLTSFIILSCSDKNDFESYLKDIDIELSNDYKIDSINSYGFTDWTLNAYVTIHEKDKLTIIESLSAKSSFPKIEDEKEVFTSNTIRNDSLFGYKIGSKYYYRFEEARMTTHKGVRQKAGYESYKVELDTISNRMIFNYEYE